MDARAIDAEIRDALRTIGDDHDVTILAARDYGSRARGLAGPNSDYDVFYLFLDSYPEHVTNMARDVIDDQSYGPHDVELHGWSLEKFISLDSGLMSSNPMALEFVASRKRYYMKPASYEPLARLCAHAREMFKPYALIRHYRSKVASNYGKYIEHGWVVEASRDELAALAPDGITTTQTAIDGESYGASEGYLTVGILGYDDHTTSIPLDKARRRGLVRRTTRDPSVKRNLVVLEGLFHALYVEHSHKLPPMDVDDLLPIVRNTLPVPMDVVEEFEDLVEMKRTGDADLEVGNVAGDWVESELDRDINSEDHLQRSPDDEVIQECVTDLLSCLGH